MRVSASAALSRIERPPLDIWYRIVPYSVQMVPSGTKTQKGKDHDQAKNPVTGATRKTGSIIVSELLGPGIPSTPWCAEKRGTVRGLRDGRSQ